MNKPEIKEHDIGAVIQVLGDGEYLIEFVNDDGESTLIYGSIEIKNTQDCYCYWDEVVFNKLKYSGSH